MNPLWDRAQAMCLFLGWSRSGTSLVGSVLNAHPDALIAHEADVVTLVARGAGREEVAAAIVRAEEGFAARGRNWNGFDYRIPGAAGPPTRPLLVGDKKAASTAEVLTVDPGALDRTEAVVRLPLRLVCVVRDPLDVVARLSRHLDTDCPDWFAPGPDPLASAADLYLILAATVQRVVDERAESVHVLHLDDLAADPAGEIRRLFAFAGLPDDPLLAERAAGVVFDEPRAARGITAWPDEVLGRIDAAARRLPLLQRYAVLREYAR